MRDLRYIKTTTDQLVRQWTGHNSYGALLSDTGRRACKGAGGLLGFIEDLLEEIFTLVERPAVPEVPQVREPVQKSCFRCKRSVTAQEDGLFRCPCGRRFR